MVARDGVAYPVGGFSSVLEVASVAIARGTDVATVIGDTDRGPAFDLQEALLAGEWLAPIDHLDPAHIFVTGTGLTHLGSAEGRGRTHRAAAAGGAELTDSMRMVLEGLEGGKPAPGEAGQQPEWFYKGVGSHVVGTEQPLAMPQFALDGGEEPEFAGIYLIGPDGTPHRLGFCLGNEFSDHVTERHNYLWLAHSKLRQAALGPELLVGDLPADVRGTSRMDGPTAMWSLILVGPFYSIMFPTIFTLAIKGMVPLTEEGSGLLIMAIAGGALVFVRGNWADAYGLQSSFIITAVCELYILFYAIWGSKPTGTQRTVEATPYVEMQS